MLGTLQESLKLSVCGGGAGGLFQVDKLKA